MTTIPSTLDEAVALLVGQIPPKVKQMIKSLGADSACMHMSVGRDIRNEWGLWTGSALRDWFLDRGVWHADDMSSIIISKAIAELKDIDYSIEDDIERFNAHWAEQGVSLEEKLADLGRTTKNGEQSQPECDMQAPPAEANTQSIDTYLKLAKELLDKGLEMCNQDQKLKEENTTCPEMERRVKIMNDIQAEREYQDRQWGGEDNDDDNTLNDWTNFLFRYTSNAIHAPSEAEQRRQLIKVAALAVAAVESFDRNEGFPSN